MKCYFESFFMFQFIICDKKKRKIVKNRHTYIKNFYIKDNLIEILK